MGAIKILTGTQLSVGFHCTMTDLLGWQVNAACSQRASVLCHLNNFFRLHVYPQWLLNSPKQVFERARWNLQYLLLPGLACRFSTQIGPIHCGRELHSVSFGILAKRQEYLEGNLEPGYYSSQGRELWT